MLGVTDPSPQPLDSETEVFIRGWMSRDYELALVSAHDYWKAKHEATVSTLQAFAAELQLGVSGPSVVGAAFASEMLKRIEAPTGQARTWWVDCCDGRVDCDTIEEAEQILSDALAEARTEARANSEWPEDVGRLSMGYSITTKRAVSRTVEADEGADEGWVDYDIREVE